MPELHDYERLTAVKHWPQTDQDRWRIAGTAHESRQTALREAATAMAEAAPKLTDIIESAELLARWYGNEPGRDQPDDVELFKRHVVEFTQEVHALIFKGNRDHPYVREWAAGARTFGGQAFRRFRNIDIAELKSAKDYSCVDIVDGWLLEEAPTLLEDTCNTLETVRKELSRRVAAICPDCTAVEMLRTKLSRPLRTRQAFYQRLQKLALVPVAKKPRPPSGAM